MLFLTYSILLFLFAFTPSSLGAIESKDSEYTKEQHIFSKHQSIDPSYDAITMILEIGYLKKIENSI